MSFRLDLLRETTAWAETLEDYGTKATSRLDDKAQQTGGLAGLFLAAAFGFLKPDSFALPPGHLRTAAFCLLFAIVLIFVLCIGACLTVTWLRQTPVPIALDVVMGLQEGVLDLQDHQLTDAIQENTYYDRLRIWADILSKRTALNQMKARRLLVAQSLLALGIFLCAALLTCAVSSMILPHGIYGR